MAISFNHIPANVRVPLFKAEVDASQAGYFTQNQRALLVGQIHAAGTAAAGVPIMVSGVAQARALFGAGSILARMVETYRRNDDFGEIWCLPLADDAGAASASGSVALTGTASAAGTLSLYIAGQLVRQGVAAGDTAAAVATALTATITGMPDLPVTAAVDGAASGTITLTAKHKGALGNDIDIRCNYLGAIGGEAYPAGLSAVVTAMSGGTANPSLSAALAALGDEEFDFLACPYTDTASLDALKRGTYRIWLTAPAANSAQSVARCKR